MWFPLELLAVTCWAAVNVLDSVIVHNYDTRPYVLQWHQSFFTLSVIALVGILTMPIHTTWIVPLLLGGVIAYAGDWTFFVVLRHLDTSVSNIAWGIQSVFLSIGGLILFGETWSGLQAVGVLFLIIGMALLSLWGKHLDWKGFLLVLLLGALYAPFYMLQKAALMAGEPALIAFFWPLLSREVIAGVLPILVPSWRRDVFKVFRTQQPGFKYFNGAVVGLFFAGIYFTVLAFERGPISLVSVVGNVQPFIVLLIAWIVVKLAPMKAAKELLTKQAVGVKIISFLIVFGGLVLLTIH